MAGGVLLVIGLTWVLLLKDGEPSPQITVTPAPERMMEVTPAPAVRARLRPLAPDLVPPAATGAALSAALNEERVELSSSARIEGIDADRPWVCTGEPLTLSARTGGEAEPGMVSRWVWPGSETGAELQPGARLPWRAPATAGRYFVRFQLCKDLGGRRVGVLAEQVVGIDVRACGPGEGQADALRIEVSQRGNEDFSFRAVSPKSATTYAWDFGDGNSAVTTEPGATHVYAAQAPGEPDVRSFTVSLSAGGAGGEQTATTFVQVRAQPPSDAPPGASLKLERVTGQAASEGWKSQLQVDVPEGSEVAWERVERLTVGWDDQVEVRTSGWREVITVDEDLGRGGFRGHVTVLPSDVRPEVKQVIDSLHGRDATGKDVSLSWSSYKAGPQRVPPVPSERPLPK
ncbi:PKD domain-containing protein [Corallococcus llansteffanensis]|uniref:PKD domain-containing protein n=1 Tax=Corallococcus llansteffanensis TaxID=2316731 RepID=A0A3A8PFE0_9BACT|nr:PKD domain-containing protein [Corallococcus llansteffanensis]RKH54689.1 PKD domain-containing protein [Corallococcus llansteffanensis]